MSEAFDPSELRSQFALQGYVLVLPFMLSLEKRRHLRVAFRGRAGHLLVGKHTQTVQILNVSDSGIFAAYPEPDLPHLEHVALEVGGTRIKGKVAHCTGATEELPAGYGIEIVGAPTDIVEHVVAPVEQDGFGASVAHVSQTTEAPLLFGVQQLRKARTLMFLSDPNAAVQIGNSLTKRLLTSVAFPSPNNVAEMLQDGALLRADAAIIDFDYGDSVHRLVAVLRALFPEIVLLGVATHLPNVRQRSVLRKMGVYTLLLKPFDTRVAATRLHQCLEAYIPQEMATMEIPFAKRGDMLGHFMATADIGNRDIEVLQNLDAPAPKKTKA